MDNGADLQVRVGGEWANLWGTVSGLKFSTQANGGCWTASWSMPGVDARTAAPAWDARTSVEIVLGGQCVWQGVLRDPQWDSGSFSAIGLGQLAGDRLALDSSGNPTTVPNTAVDQAIARGLPWIRPNTISTAAVASVDKGGLRIGALLDAYCTGAGLMWTVGPDRIISTFAPPTAATWMLTPGEIDQMSIDGEDYATNLYATYQYVDVDSTASPKPVLTATTSAATSDDRFATVEYPVDLTPLGPFGTPSTTAAAKSLGATSAQSLLNGMLALGKGRPAYLDDINGNALTLLTADGAPAELALVHAGDAVLVSGAIDAYGMGINPLVVIGATNYDHDTRTVQCIPAGRSARSLQEIFTVSAPADTTTTPSL